MDKLEQMRGEIREAARTIQSRVPHEAAIAVILGSGLGSVAEKVDGAVSLDYEEIPYFPIPLTAGHPGKLFAGKFGQKNVVLLQGRPHLYEGYTMQGVAFPVNVLREMGIKTLIVTNSASGLNPAFETGDLMLITDHLNLTGDNPLIGPNDDEVGLRFPDMSDAYSPRLLAVARAVAKEKKLKIQEGVYAGVIGPSYETRAEIAYLQKIEADAVGMSTVLEVIVARHADIEVLGISCITNEFSKNEKMSHDKVLEKAKETSESLYQLIVGVVGRLAG